MKALKESILDDIDSTLNNGDELLYLSNIYNLWYKGNDVSGKDVLGKKLEIGDLVIKIEAYSPLIGKIIDIKNKKAAVSLTGDGNDIKDKQGIITPLNYTNTYELLKINKEILKLISNIK
jgi:hypothetical protein